MRKKGEEIIWSKIIWGISGQTNLAGEDKYRADTGDNLGKAQMMEG